MDVTPQQLRLMVALVQLGDDASALVQHASAYQRMHARADLDALEARFENVLRQPDQQALRTGLHRVLLSRFPLPLGPHGNCRASLAQGLPC